MKLTDEQIAYCMECGVCAGSCPVTRNYEDFSPRLVIKHLLVDRKDAVTRSPVIWRCITCARCSVRCPALIDIPKVVHEYREKARKDGYHPQPSHHEVLQIIPRLQLRSPSQKRTDWASQWRTKEKGDYFYFVGCAPYFNSIFQYLEIRPMNTPEAVLTLLNTLGIEPVVSNEEVCCGHDALWTGDEEAFAQLARRNVDAIKKAGAKTVIFSCPEGYITFKQEYPKIVGELPFQIVYASEFFTSHFDQLKELLSNGVSDAPERVTYHDPCRLGRFDGIYDSPRMLIDAVPGSERFEMERSRENALCCGTSAWIECSSCSKAIQFDRLEEAFDTTYQDENLAGGVLITACPKCFIHLNCAKTALPDDHRAKNLKIEDLFVFLARHIVRK